MFGGFGNVLSFQIHYLLHYLIMDLLGVLHIQMFADVSFCIVKEVDIQAILLESGPSHVLAFSPK